MLSGLELLALSSAVKGGAKVIEGGLDWLNSKEPSKEERELLGELKKQANTPAISGEELNRGIMAGQLSADSTMNRGINDARGVLQSQGLGNSVLTTQVPLDSAQELASSRNALVTNVVNNASMINKEKQTQDRLTYLEARNRLAKMRKERGSNAISKMVDGAVGIGSAYGSYLEGSDLLAGGGNDISGVDIASLYEQQRPSGENKSGTDPLRRSQAENRGY